MKRLLFSGTMIFVLAVAVSSLYWRIRFREVPPSSTPGITVLRDDKGNRSLVIWEATWRFPPDHANIVVWDEISKDAGWLQTKRWRNSDSVLMLTTSLVDKVVCSCTPQRSIVDQRSQPETCLITRRTVASYPTLVDGDSGTAAPEGGRLEGPEHENCSGIKVRELVATVAETGADIDRFTEGLESQADE